ncbi:hypothetical protein PISMIDRAFT_25322 [Pisolithus microcarpus 441]|uniref:Uncharacterized protein n=1 Tax=Pisolithus microcarpus 441 TaxID=765257 RepID=A0A0C9YM23_9AGAM|nr:hypothetical protein PISMIDRAFT_25322 [Pisolithus microcarpus 441]
MAINIQLDKLSLSPSSKCQGWNNRTPKLEEVVDSGSMDIYKEALPVPKGMGRASEAGSTPKSLHLPCSIRKPTTSDISNESQGVRRAEEDTLLLPSSSATGEGNSTSDELGIGQEDHWDAGGA